MIWSKYVSIHEKFMHICNVTSKCACYLVFTYLTWTTAWRKKSQEEFLILKRNIAKKIEIRIGLTTPGATAAAAAAAAMQVASHYGKAYCGGDAVTLSFIVGIHPLKCSCRTGALASIRAKRWSGWWQWQPFAPCELLCHWWLKQGHQSNEILINYLLAFENK